MGALINEDRFGLVALAITPAEVAAATSAAQSFTLTGAEMGMLLVVQKPTTTAGIICYGGRVSAANTIQIAFANVTAGALTPPAETYAVFWFRAERTSASILI